jgi:ankyrin repeat protein
VVFSEGTMWRHAPALVPNARLARAVTARDPAQVSAALPGVARIDTYLEDAPLVMAARNGDAGIVQLLLGAGAHAGNERALRTAVAKGHAATIQVLLASGVSPDCMDPDTRERPLHLAADHKVSPSILQLLIGAGADVNALDGSDEMPLQAALRVCDAEAAAVLVRAGADRRWARSDEFGAELMRASCPPSTTAALQKLIAGP